MTWFSRAAPSATDPRGATTLAREGGGAGRTKRTVEGGQPGEHEQRNASARAAALKVWAVPRGRRAREWERVEPAPNWSKELNWEL